MLSRSEQPGERAFYLQSAGWAGVFGQDRLVAALGQELLMGLVEAMVGLGRESGAQDGAWILGDAGAGVGTQLDCHVLAADVDHWTISWYSPPSPVRA